VTPRGFPKMLSPSQLMQAQGFVAPARPHFASPAALEINHFDDAIVYTIGCNVWTSSAAHHDALKLCRDKERTFRELIDGEQPWSVPEAKRAKGKNDFVDMKRRERMRDFEARLNTAGIVRNVAQDASGNRQSFFGYRVAFDDRIILTEMTRLGLDWMLTEPKPIAVSPAQGGGTQWPAFEGHAYTVQLQRGHLSGATFELVDCGAVVWASVLSGFYSQSLIQRAFASTEAAIRFAVETTDEDRKMKVVLRKDDAR
jgi:hypothetical protein